MAGLWINAHDYGARLLRSGVEPWSEPEDIGPFARELLTLLRPERIVLPLEPLIAPVLTNAESASARVDAFDNAVAADLIASKLETAVRSTDASGHLSRIALLVPGPGRIAGGDADEDDRDVAVMALGDLLRCLAPFPALSVLLDEPDEDAREEAESLARIAEHLGLQYAVLQSDDGPVVASGDLFSLAAAGDTDRQTLVTVPVDAHPETVLAHLAKGR